MIEIIVNFRNFFIIIYRHHGFHLMKLLPFYHDDVLTFFQKTLQFMLFFLIILHLKKMHFGPSASSNPSLPNNNNKVSLPFSNFVLHGITITITTVPIGNVVDFFPNKYGRFVALFPSSTTDF